MKKMLSLLLVAVMSSMASAAVISLSTYDVGSSGGRLGTSDLDALQGGDVVGLQMVLEHNAYAGFPSYDGNFTSQFALKLASSGNGSLSVPQVVQGKNLVFDVKMNAAFDLGVKKIAAVAGDNPVTNGGLNIDFLEAALLSGGLGAAPGGSVLVWNILFTADGTADTEMALNAGTGGLYSSYKNFAGDNYFPASSPITNGDVSGTTIHQVPEPMTMTLLGLGGIAALRRRRA